MAEPGNWKCPPSSYECQYDVPPARARGKGTLILSDFHDRRRQIAVANQVVDRHNDGMSCRDPATEEADEKKSPDWRRPIALVATPITASVTLAALAGFAGRWGWGFELASHFRVQYFWGLLLGTAALFVARRTRTALAAGLLVVVHAGLLWPFYEPVAKSDPGKPRLRVLSLNVHSANRRHDDVLRLVREESPDVAVFLEVNEPWSAALAALDEEWPYSRTQARDGNFGIALYSRLPLDDARIEPLLSDRCPAVVARVTVGNTPVTVFGAHPFPPLTGDAAESRDRQLAALADLVIASGGETVIVGDLNTTSWSPVFAEFVSKTALRDSRAGMGVQPSWPSHWPIALRIPIDHCLVSNGIKVTARSIGREIGSDHLPVRVDLAIDTDQSP